MEQSSKPNHLQNIGGYSYTTGLFFFQRDGKIYSHILELKWPRSTPEDLADVLGEDLLALIDPYSDILGKGKRVTRQCGWYKDDVFADEDGNLCLSDFYEKFNWTRHVGRTLLL